jgi:hypothetical protein
LQISERGRRTLPENNSAENAESKPVRRYDKGERRFKHVGREPIATIEFIDENPKMAVGKCPNTLGHEACEDILAGAIDGSNGDRELPFPKKLYAVHDGVIYEAQTTDWGKSYHGYPFRGRLTRKLLGKLREIAEREKCATEFESWVKRHIL